jgi:hypothetical protein
LPFLHRALDSGSIKPLPQVTQLFSGGFLVEATTHETLMGSAIWVVFVMSMVTSQLPFVILLTLLAIQL